MEEGERTERLVDRLNSLHRQLRYLKIGLCCTVVAFLVLFVWYVWLPAETVRGQSFELIGPDGLVRARMEASTDGVSFAFFDSDEVTGILCELSDTLGPWIWLNCPEGQNRLSLSMKKVKPGITLAGAEEEASLFIDERRVGLYLSGESTILRMGLDNKVVQNVSPDGGDLTMSYGENEALGLHFSRQGGRIKVMDSEGDPVLRILSTDKGEAVLQVIDDDGS